MATNTEVFEHFLTPMRQVFHRPPQMAENEQSAALLQYADAVRGYSSETLKLAWAAVRDSHRGRDWPSPGVCVKACRDASREVREQRAAAHPDAITGRMVDGEWQPWVGCNCTRCRTNREAYHRQDAETFGRFSPWHPDYGKPLPPEMQARQEKWMAELNMGPSRKRPVFADGIRADDGSRDYDLAKLAAKKANR